MAKKRKRRLVGRAVVCLFLGSVMTVAVAWGCALFAKTTTMSSEKETDSPFYERYRRPGWPPVERVVILDGIGVSQRHASGSVSFERDYRTGGTPTVPDAVYFAVYEIQSGLPWRSVSTLGSHIGGDDQSMSEIDEELLIPVSFSLLARGLEAPSWFPQRFHGRTLPLRPVWPGFLYSTIAFGAFAWLALFAPSDLRRRFRHRHGLCLQCKYPLDDFAICPECGTPTQRKA